MKVARFISLSVLSCGYTVAGNTSNQSSHEGAAGYDTRLRRVTGDTISPPSPPSDSFPGQSVTYCHDEPDWYDSGGPQYDCGYYAQDGGKFCATEGHLYENFGMTASQACCVCGGGCYDEPGWYDEDGPEYNCHSYYEIYDVTDQVCTLEGISFKNFGLTASEACCVCGGGSNTPPDTRLDPFWEFHIDCYVADEDYLGTADSITVSFYDEDENLLGTERFDDLSCPRETQDEAVGIFSAIHVAKVYINIGEGSDAALLDDAWITRDGFEAQHFDGSGTRGWCLSSDSEDFIINDWVDNIIGDRCEPAYTFDVLSGAVHAAELYYQFFIDCHISGEVNTDTSNTIRVMFYDKDDELLATEAFDGIDCPSDSSESVGFYASKRPQKVQIEIQGRDAMLIDDAWMTEGDSEFGRWDGVGPGLGPKGYCLSEDPDDYIGNGWQENIYGDRCERSFLFNVDGAVSPPETYWAFHIDCHMSETSDSIGVWFYSASGDLLGTRTFNGLQCTIDPDGEAVGIYSSETVDMVHINTGGNDSVLIDDAWLVKGSTEFHRWDGHGVKGYCMSLDSLGYIPNGWEQNIYGEKCEPAYNFEVSTNTVSSPEKYYTFVIDCTMFERRGEATATTDFIDASFYDESGSLVGTGALEGLLCTETEGEAVGVYSSTKVSKVLLDTRGPDAALIDYALLTEDMVELYRWGGGGETSDLKGFCLSDDSNDYISNNWQDNIIGSKCERTFIFDGPTGNVSSPDLLYAFHLDCRMQDEDVEYTGTSDQVEVTFYDDSNSLVGGATFNGLACNSESEKVEITSSTRIETVNVTILGDDALLIDDAWLTEENFELYRWDGHGNLGWCLSEDPDDYIGNGWVDHVYGEKCERAFRFDASSGDVYSPELLYAFNIDCSVLKIGGSKDEKNTDTTDLVEVKFYDSSGALLGNDTFDGLRCDPLLNGNVGILSSTRVQKVTLHTGGSDAALIESAWLTEGSSELYRWSPDGDMAYCLSSDHADHVSNGWEDRTYLGRCEPTFIFDGQTSEVSLPNIDYTFFIDCQVDGDEEYQDTWNTIEIVFYDVSDNLLGLEAFNNGLACPSNPESLSISSSTEVSKVKVTTDGSDAVLIQSAWLMRGDTELYRWNGDENGCAGWCVADDSWQDSILCGNKCQAALIFDGSTMDVYDPNPSVPYYSFHIDCFMAGKENTGTSNTISVMFYGEESSLIGTEVFNELNCPEDSSEAVGIYSSVPIESVRVETSGEDALLIDDAWLLKDSIQIYRWDFGLPGSGVKGYCLSLDRDDHISQGWGENIYGESCEQSFTFESTGVSSKNTPTGPLPDPDPGQYMEFHIDCQLDNVQSTHTNDLIGVWFYDASGALLGTATFDGLECNSSPESVGIYASSSIDFLEVYIYGADAALIDDAWLTAEAVEVVRWDEFGIPGSGPKGWCLSSDGQDHFGNSWGNNIYLDKCYDEYVFDVTRKDVYPNN